MCRLRLRSAPAASAHFTRRRPGARGASATTRGADCDRARRPVTKLVICCRQVTAADGEQATPAATPPTRRLDSERAGTERQESAPRRPG